MKILFITEYFPSTSVLNTKGGVEARAYHIADAFARTHTVYVIASKEKDKPRHQIIHNITVYRVGIEREYSRKGNIVSRILFILSSIIRGLVIDFDIVEGSSITGWLPTYILCKIKKKKSSMVVADTIKNYVNDTNYLTKRLLMKLEKYILRLRWNAIITISKTVRKSILEGGQIKSKIYVIYCGCNTKKIKKLKTIKNKLFTICCIARLVPYKRVEDLIRAVALMKHKRIYVKVKIIGDGESYESLVILCVKSGIKEQVKFYRFIRNHTHVLQILKSSHVFCLPSIAEGFGIATVEAMSCGLPVILADTPINREITGTGGVLFFSAKNSKNLAEKILIAYKNKDQYNLLCQRSLRVAEKYDWEKSFEKLKKLYESMCNY